MALHPGNIWLHYANPRVDFGSWADEMDEFPMPGKLLF